MARKRRKKEKTESAGSPAWMATYSDMMSLLLCFFIILFSMSVVSEERFREVADSLKIALDGNSSDSILENSGDSIADLDFEDIAESSDFEELDPEDLAIENTPVNEEAVPEEVIELYDTVNSYLVEEDLNADVTLSRDQDGVYIDIQEAIMFEPGRAVLREDGLETMGRLAGLFEVFNNEIIIEGYTDDVPTSGIEFPTNWELSAARSVNVLRYLYENHSIEPSRLSARGYGEYSPSVPNDSVENRSLNRRVNIVIVHNEREEVVNGSE